jgi:hypothetical protein
MAEPKEPITLGKSWPPSIHRVSITIPITTGISRSALVASHIKISAMFIAGCPLQYPKRPFFHLLGLRSGFVEPGLKVCPTMLPGHVDGGPHIVSQDNEL